jgi:hypothetical protein
MSVLARELDSYQRAVDAYRRQTNDHNRKVDAYRNTLVRDADGNVLLIDASNAVFSADPDGKLTRTGLPSGSLSDYGMTELPDDPRFRLLRQNPTDSKRETRDDVQYYQDSETGEQYYYTVTPGQGDAGPTRERLGSEWRMEQAMPQRWEEPQRYQFSRNISGFTEKPPEWDREFTRVEPNPTAAQIRRAATPSLAQMEAGLIGQVMRSGGVKYGVPEYRPRT